ncbi:hypothetical protein PoB_001661200 [Plakobranchus ocellatus]|uniref:Uncharacterized protein n=1 Tax=Plakobranchus ocellatus TaxID=259542 RepID=A0AAV3Z4B8_9GAST|nr:hypothetical protein PoB_001661200 [Plakobranchus ocellatus]
MRTMLDSHLSSVEYKESRGKVRQNDDDVGWPLLQSICDNDKYDKYDYDDEAANGTNEDYNNSPVDDDNNKDQDYDDDDGDEGNQHNEMKY